ncbi:exodeoxyribonuclease V subunit alpha [Neptunicella sp. SCSIO 80796]|uniref:exodeoxyribonuclease V subunit alpha n=1 Tax=Neptunicella plasticusilytica TaxID=3117012 RepID=UPI003A4D8B4B
MSYSSSQHCMNALAEVEAIDYFVASELLTEFGQPDNPLLLHCFIALSQFLRNGSSCMPLMIIADKTLWADGVGKKGYTFATLDELQQQLCLLDIGTENDASIVLEDGCLYLRRYWQFEQEVAGNLLQRIHHSISLDTQQQQTARQALSALFPQQANSREVDYQAVAVANALQRRLSVISGGPGTGKTYTVTKLLLALKWLYGDGLKIKLAAPTGKAAQRMKESISNNLSSIQQRQDLAIELDTDASTLHRLLGISRDPVSPRFHRERQINCDVLVIDEVSMLDLPMMTRLLRALPDSAQLILLGDAQQLASVEVGQVMRDISCIPHPGYSAGTVANIIGLLDVADWQIALSASEGQPDYDYLTILNKTHRQALSASQQSISHLASMVIGDQAEASWALLQQSQSDQDNLQASLFEQGQLSLFDADLSVDGTEVPVELAALTKRYFRPVAQAMDIQQAFNALHRFRILLPTRVGDAGVEAVNSKIEQLLYGGTHRASSWYRGRPVMVTENDYANGLFNGDVGLIWPSEQGQLVAYFEQADGLRNVALSRLPKVETVYAMTIHKTQGSEFSRVAIMLPAKGNKVMSKELLYTGITRAREHVYLFASQNSWLAAFNNPANRYSGLKGRLIPEE